MPVENQSNDDTRTHVILSEGTMVGRYRIVEKIGAGGMGEVYLAQDTELDRKVALKFLPHHMCADEDLRARFKREAQAAARLSHPNIVTVYEVGECNGRPYIAMEYVAGQSLKERLSQSRVGLDQVIDGAIQVCDGLQTAHKAGVIHRDIKPSNIIIDSDNRARILDFGLAMMQSSDPVTRPGTTLGTIGYMSPEQVSGHEVDHRTDLFSVGVILYELFTGLSPFKRETEAATLNAILHDIPAPITRYVSGIPDDLQRIIIKLLDKNPDLRYQNAADVACDLKRIKSGSTESESVKSSESSLPSIAVLPFTNLSADPEQEYFCDGMAEEIINALTHIDGLRVVARTSCFAFKGKHGDIREIGRKLNVENILEGSVRKAGNRIRITGQLITVADGYHLWSERYDRELSDVFEVQDEISIAIVENLKVKLLGEHEPIVKRPTDNLETYTLYLKGRYHWNQRRAREVHKAIRCLEKAVELDPQFALGFAGLADAYIVLCNITGDNEKRSKQLASAEKAALNALVLDNSLGEAHTAMAQIRFAQWRWDEAEKEYLSAFRLNPNYATAHHWYALFSAAHGKLERAREHIELARNLDPLSPSIIAAQAICSYLSGKYDEAIKICREGIEISPEFSIYSEIIGWSLTQKGNYVEAIKLSYKGIELSKKWEDEGDDTIINMAHIGRIYAMMGDNDKAKDILEEIIERTKDRSVPLFPVAALSFALGEFDSGFEWLEKSVDKKEYWIPVFRHSPDFDVVRNDPTFLSIMRRIGLDQDTTRPAND